ncbi:hypothetical protein Bpfe_000534 [Biomphalaria pfeifferi]|uniref:Uncharacterized protein n=1 Tax=Biomphalaria pfeifferi TaxID=112525 RepID=A0AAD8FPV6_BIOPF|nr:hypothetical protein Bpfe_000534 [Biomphalaria pfeifferi]
MSGKNTEQKSNPSTLPFPHNRMTHCRVDSSLLRALTAHNPSKAIFVCPVGIFAQRELLWSPNLATREPRIAACYRTPMANCFQAVNAVFSPSRGTQDRSVAGARIASLPSRQCGPLS